MKHSFSVLISLTFISQPLWATNLKSKFESLVSKIESNLVGYNENNIDTLASGGLRGTLFTIQTMAELYQSKYQGLSSIHRDTKALEDEIGAYRKKIEQYEFAVAHNASADRIRQLDQRRQQGRQELKSYIQSEQWNLINDGEISRLKQILNAMAWDFDANDKVYTFQSLHRQMKTIAETPWSMDRLVGNGLHDLRKQIRWYKLEVSTLSDLVTFQSKTCDREPHNVLQGGVCVLSKCLDDRLDQMNEVLSSIKDEGEGHEGLGEEVPAELYRRAHQIYGEAKKDQIIERLATEFSNCAKSAGGEE